MTNLVDVAQLEKMEPGQVHTIRVDHLILGTTLESLRVLRVGQMVRNLAYNDVLNPGEIGEVTGIYRRLAVALDGSIVISHVVNLSVGMQNGQLMKVSTFRPWTLQIISE